MTEKKSLLPALALSALLFFPGTEAEAQRFRHVGGPRTQSRTAVAAARQGHSMTDQTPEQQTALRNERIARLRSELARELADSINADTLNRVRSVSEIMAATELPARRPTAVNKILGPWIFSGYRSTLKKRTFRPEQDEAALRGMWLDARDSVTMAGARAAAAFSENPDSVVAQAEASLPLRYGTLPVMTGEVTPGWLLNAMTANRMQEDFMYNNMVENPAYVDKAYWDLPVPPRLPDEDYSIHGFISRLNLPPVNVDDADTERFAINKVHWLHTLNLGLQFSQAYLSQNWYQGGNNYLALLGNFYWDVQLNQVYHPKLMFQSTLSYKLGLNSIQDDPYRKYSISEDLLQYNVKFGYKAAHSWYYSVTGQFKTQMLNNYKKGTNDRTASFLTPGELNFGIGMTYSHQNKKKTFTFNASIAPLSYNLKTAISSKIDHTKFKIDQDKRSSSEIGSNAELTLSWQIFKNVNYKSRLFVFTDYGSFLGDWQNTLDFQFNRFFSTQIYANLRYDSEADPAKAPGWRKWMLKEILSVGLSYTFATKSK